MCCLDNPAPTPGAEQEDHTPIMNTDHDLKTPDDSILDHINSQSPNDGQIEHAALSSLVEGKDLLGVA